MRHKVYRHVLLGIIVSMTLFACSHKSATKLAPGNPAPAFELKDQNGRLQAPDDYRGQWLVLYFYPKDDTPGCTTEACHFRDDIHQIQALGAKVIGVSIDNQESHQAFAEKHGLPFPLLADSKGKVAAAYGSIWSFGPFRLAKRHTFIIDPHGRVAKIYRKVDPKQHSQRIIADLKQLQQENKQD
jgi:peroxiredoxin Q/BCP